MTDSCAAAPQLSVIYHHSLPPPPLTQPSTARHGWLVQEGWNRHQGPRPPKPPRHNNCHICGRPFLTTSRGAILLKVMEKHRQSHNPPKPPKPSRHQGPQLGPPNRKNCDICGRPFLTNRAGAILLKIMEKHKQSHNPPKPPKPPRHQGPQLGTPNRKNCDICGRPFLTNSAGAILKHKQSHCRMECKFCGRIFKGERWLKKHQTEPSLDRIEAENSKTLEKARKNNKVIHSECGMCGKVCMSMGQINAHTALHSCWG